MKKRVLFVDDEPNFLSGVRRMLRGNRDEWELSFAGGVDEALEMTAETDFDAIVSDVTMPEKTGLDLLAALREGARTSATPVIILTGNAEADLKRKALDLGATDLLNKPVSQEDLTARLRSVLRLKAYQDQLRDQNRLLEDRVQERTADLEHARRDIIWRLAKAGELRDEETGEHVIRVACCSRALATALGLETHLVREIFLTSPLHDVGKIGIPDSILLKAGGLSAEERKIMESHCEIGASILLSEPKGIEAFLEYPEGYKRKNEGASIRDSLRDLAATIIMTHHEKWDGTGYPEGLKGEEIPLAGQIVAVTDVYDALRAERPYKQAYSLERTLETMRGGREKHFAPDVFDAFELIVEEFEAIRERFLS